MTNANFDFTKMNVKRMGHRIMVRAWEYSESGFSTISMINKTDKINGKTAEEMTDDEIIAAWSPTSKNFSH